MRKFFVLLKKEIRELFTVQMIIPIVIGLAIFMLLGTVIGDAMKESHEGEGGAGQLVVLDLDDSGLSGETIKLLNASGFSVMTNHKGEVSEILEKAKLMEADAVLVIKEGFEKNALEGKPQIIDAYSLLKSLSLAGQTGDAVLQSAITQVNEYVSNKLILGLNESHEMKPEDIKNPVIQNNFVVINGKTANVSSTAIKSFLLSQNIFIPVVMLMIIIYSAQLLITTIASEKENKTMETLLSTPVTRSGIIASKMVAAGLSALVFAITYMIGFQYYMGSLTGTLTGDENAALKHAIEQLGLTMGAGDYIILGISLFTSILVALALASILGSMAEDVKKAQGYITPVMLIVMVPYILTMFIDVTTAKLPIKILINAIPFAHPFQASSMLYLNQYLSVILGILYQLGIFALLLYIATKIYSSDRIFMSKHSSLKSRKRNLRKN